MEIKDNTFLRQFETTLNESLLSVEYSLQERKIFLTKLNIPQDLSEELTTDLLKEILKNIEERNLKVVPTAPKIVSFFRRNPSYKSMLPPGIVI